MLKLRRIGVCFLLICSVLGSVALGDKTARARGGHSGLGHGIGSFQLELSQGQRASGWMQYAAEDHAAMYPEIIVKLDSFAFADILPGVATFGGTGTFGDDTVSISGQAIDGAFSGRPDSFSITCRDSHGSVVFHVAAELTSGDIAIQGN